ncbi:putative bifunctional diguanylate cyclase/phosphodiesterase [Comamonas badia]|uniref:putative bifunctional diguanylate cyclase/phosphodiesterase n=1 Tax=Comamonas badia TaxID=265291 RepID=UPI000419BDD5|nr:EAL domain-containing protein [Comamonas badia]
MNQDSDFAETALPAQREMAAQAASLRQQRLGQILVALMLAFAAVIAVNVASGRANMNVVMEGAAIALFAFARQRNRRGDVIGAAWILLVTLMVVLTSLMVFGQGLYDEVPMAFPGILVMALMFADGRVFSAVLATMLLVLIGVYALQATGVLPAVPGAVEPSRLLVLAVILCVTAYFVHTITKDLRLLLDQQEADKQALAQSHQQIAELAYHDPLTHLPNRALGLQRLQFLLAEARRGGHQVAVMFLDLDNFKTINDSLGHAAGDELLRQVSERLQACLRTTDMVARLSGDEFLLLLGAVEDERAITTMASKVMEQLAPVFNLQGVEVHASGSLGISVSPRDGDALETLLKHADLAMYQAKAAGRNTFRFFDESMNANMLAHLHLVNALRQALATDALQLYYQPQLALTSGRVIGAEALLRWHHPELGWVPPNEFIPVAESSGLIHDLGTWVLYRACRDARTFRIQGLADLTVAVNVSPLQFRRGNLKELVAQALAAHALPPSALELEITESVLIDDRQRPNEMLDSLHGLGVRIAIDDFGTGYSNLSYLQRYPLHRLKIDRSFTSQVTSSPQAAGIVQAIIEMGHCLRLQLVAEGVEDMATLTRLRNAGCEFGQGFHWSPAIPAEQFVAFARQSRSRPPA